MAGAGMRSRAPRVGAAASLRGGAVGGGAARRRCDGVDAAVSGCGVSQLSDGTGICRSEVARRRGAKAWRWQLIYC